MARPKRPAWRVEQVKNKIFQATLELFNKHGYDAVTIRKIARRAGCSPATIYNYYSDKDALYLDILAEGFAILHGLLQAQPRAADPLQTIRGYTAVFYRFSLDHPYYYDIMFSFHVPKYLDYTGTAAEETAFAEKAVALKNMELLLDALGEFYRGGPAYEEEDPGALTKKALALLGLCHGIISLHRSGIWAELDVDFSTLYFSAVDDFLQKPAREKEDQAAPRRRVYSENRGVTGSLPK